MSPKLEMAVPNLPPDAWLPDRTPFIKSNF